MASLFIVVNEDRFFLSHRKDIAKAAIAAGYEVTIVAKNTGRKEEVEALGAKYVDMPVNPTGMNLLQELKTYFFLHRLFRSQRPDIVHVIGLKQILWGSLAAKFTRVPLLVSAVSGLGVMFSGDKLSFCARAILQMLRFSHRRSGSYMIFQNNVDCRLFLDYKIATPDQLYFTKGSGIDLKEFSYTPESESEKLHVIFTARMVKEKGMTTLIDAAELLRDKYEDKVEFWLCGGLSDNPLAIKEDELRAMCDDKYIKWLGHRTDVHELLMKSHIMAFPSYYREGLPKSLIEASAIGRPIITTDSVGCRDVVEDGINGYLIPIKDASTLADRLGKLFEDKELRVRMGLKSREFAERDFSIENVVNTHLEIYNKVKTSNMKKVFVSGCYDLLHSGHVEFFQQASQFGELYVGIGSDATYLEYKHRKPMFPEQERLFMVKNIKAVKEAYINEGRGVIDFLPTLDLVKPDIFVVNAEGGSDAKRQLCEERGIQYIELQRTPHEGLEARSSSSLKAALSTQEANSQQPTANEGIPTRLDLAGTWIDQPYVSMYHPGWAITISLEPTFEVRDRCGLSTSTRKMIQKIWPMKLPKMDPEMLARLVFCFENSPEREDGHISGAQDSIGICVPGLCRHYYDNNFWPKKIEVCSDEMSLRFLEDHLVMVPMEPRKPGCTVVEGKDITPAKVKALAAAADACWTAILAHDLDAFAAAYRASFAAQIAMFPGMIKPTYFPANSQPTNEARVEESTLTSTEQGGGKACVAGLTANSQQLNAYIAEAIAHYSAMDDVLAWKMPGAGGGGYLALVVTDAQEFIKNHSEAFELHIRRE